MTELVVTSFSETGEEAYGSRMVKTFRHYWPCPLLVYVDGPTHVKGVGIRRTAEIPGWLETRERLPTKAPDPTWYKASGYLWNARRFAVKPFVWCDAAEHMGAGVLTWFDGDTIALQAVRAGFSWKLLGAADVAILGRRNMHPDTGYVGFRIPEALPLLRWCREAYQSGSFRSMKGGWTDCHVLRAGIKALKVKTRSLTFRQQRVWTSREDAFQLSPLGPYVTHLKGAERKRESK